MTTHLHAVSCRFLRRGCRIDQHELFSESYARSNTKRNFKLLRCFPHCCPEHVPRSYCGCSLHVLVTFVSADQAAAADTSDDVVVCARFEAASPVAVAGAGDVATAMPPDSIVALPVSALQLSIDTTADKHHWVRAEKADDRYQQQFPEVSGVYGTTYQL
ncbi:hypothetical protein F441_16748 [Phytophthora nicotianae CJ01A1]|uniref:Uncharacterized protein n=4 Tax=Phytophthora nicotianae TaxID=4792 RepID=W2P9A9_PHYN3|nr:hypothetical protein PPTG_20406 [Phytophthora nicotianae INRA-310]XP_008917448.1 hypothetical protein PPTG_20407 [Phytophthora nicotianae INRA-310]ETI37078.1 hypothetical protein F443_16905 [Phytophthora nicotianae P1569]ETK77295.1 hypothetical protein L915_16434 [Phytophthora nicotianae]ETP06920.1 hypothetical protein F441_16748 [Phytophthora nicotianae CJ01A1]ETM97255.1 hypothetical protein PPTG_20406 [Phytophthora nicotianae INRA-310]ETM97256.1 hypothetical protein PPTG_20407 [Phytophth